MTIHDHFMTSTPGGFLHLSEWGEGNYLYFISTRLPDEDELRGFPVFPTLEAALDDMVQKTDDWFNGEPIYVSPQAKQSVMIRVHRFLRQHFVLAHEHKTIPEKWKQWFKVDRKSVV